MTIAFKYALFAVISTGANILAQYFSLLAYGDIFDLYLAMAIGTLAGLMVKYVLDKKYIFYYATKNFRDDFKKFLLYSFMGIFTTLIFWGTELAFNAVIPYGWAKFLGAVVGLSLGYFLKYNLDKRWVFKKT